MQVKSMIDTPTGRLLIPRSRVRIPEGAPESTREFVQETGSLFSYAPTKSPTKSNVNHYPVELCNSWAFLHLFPP